MKYIVGIIFGLIALLTIILFYTKSEGFYGTSPGTLVQLASSHVPTERDLTEEKIEREQVRKDIYDMTESDL
jgi:hypothetical protein